MIKISFSEKNKQTLQLTSDSKEFAIIRDVFSVPNPAFRAVKNNRFIASRLYAITPTGRFDSGLLDEVVKAISEHGFPFEISPEVSEFFQGCPSVSKLDELAITYRFYQKDAIEAALKHGRGVILVGTGGGKTLLTAGIIQNIRKSINKPNAKVMVTVPTIQLVEQTANDFLEYGLTNVCKWSGKNKLDHSADIVIAGTQYLVGKNTDLSMLADIDIFIADECHGYRKGTEISRVLQLLTTPYRFGLTGSLPTEKIDQWNIFGKLGPVIFEKKTKELKDNEFVSDFQVYILNIDHGNKSFSFDQGSPTSKYVKELEFLMTNKRRNEIISNLSLKLDSNTIIMVDRIIHGEEIEKSLKEKCGDRPIYFIQGKTEIEDREKIRALMEERSDVIAIAISKIFSTGINIPNLHNIIFASAGKAKIKIIQSIGRALRLHPTKEKAKIFDIADTTFYGSQHKEERKKLYQTEKYEFSERTL